MLALQRHVSKLTDLLSLPMLPQMLFKRLFSKKDAKETGDRLEDLEKRVRRIEEEWTDVYGKFRVLQMRVAKQVQRLDENSSQEEPQGAGNDESGDSPQGPAASSFSPAQQRLQAQILARRAKLGR